MVPLFDRAFHQFGNWARTDITHFFHNAPTVSHTTLLPSCRCPCPWLPAAGDDVIKEFTTWAVDGRRRCRGRFYQVQKLLLLHPLRLFLVEENTYENGGWRQQDASAGAAGN